MDHFIHQENLAHYRRLLAQADVVSDQVRHKELKRLLAEELAKVGVPPLPDVKFHGRRLPDYH